MCPEEWFKSPDNLVFNDSNSCTQWLLVSFNFNPVVPADPEEYILEYLTGCFSIPILHDFVYKFVPNDLTFIIFFAFFFLHFGSRVPTAKSTPIPPQFWLFIEFMFSSKFSSLCSGWSSSPCMFLLYVPSPDY